MNKKIPDDIIVVIFSALGEYLKNERIETKILSVKKIHTSNFNLWGITSRQKNMLRSTLNKRL